MAGVVVLGLVIVGAQLQKRELSANIQQVELPTDITEVVQQVDDEFVASWTEQGLSPAAKADNLQIARRISLALTGRVPSLEEIRVFETIEEESASVVDSNMFNFSSK